MGIGSECSEHVARHVDFGNHGNKPIGGIFYDFTALLLCVETAVTLAVVETGVTSDDSAGTPGALRGQLGVFLDFDAPALVFGDVPVEAVHAMQGNQVNIFLHELQGEEMACAVEMHATIAEARLIGNGDCGQAHGLWLLGEHGQRLAKRLDATEHASRGLSADGDALGRNADLVAFLMLNLRIESKQNVASCHLRHLVLLAQRLAGQRLLRHFTNVVGQEVSVALHVGIAFRIDYCRLLAQYESGCLNGCHRLGQGHHVIISHLSQRGSC